MIAKNANKRRKMEKLQPKIFKIIVQIATYNDDICCARYLSVLGLLVCDLQIDFVYRGHFFI